MSSQKVLSPTEARVLLVEENAKFVQRKMEKNKDLEIPRTVSVPVVSQPISSPRTFTTMVVNDTSSNLLERFSKTHGSQIAIMNFANTRNPGGGYQVGCLAQEEELCRASPLLFPSLKEEQRRGGYPFQWSEQIKVTRDVPFCRADSTKQYQWYKKGLMATVVSCAGPDLRGLTGIEFELEEYQKNPQAVFDRIYRVIQTALTAVPEANVLILGALGCGAFAPRPLGSAAVTHYREQVARLFLKALQETPITAEMVCFGILSSPGTPSEENFPIFEKVLRPLTGTPTDGGWLKWLFGR